MGVQRKTAQINWIASFGMIILAGTLYRLRKVNNAIFKAQVSEIMQKIGQKLNWKTPITIIRPQNSSMIKGEWQQIKLTSNQYRLSQKIYKMICSIQKLFNSGWKQNKRER